MSSVDSGSDRRVRDRIELNRKVQLRFSKFQDFLTEIAGNISPGGMFVRSENPHKAGDLFEFECSLEDGYPLVSGRAEVVWVRRRPGSADEPSGMGLRFLELRDKSEVLIRRIVEQRIQAGEKTFELGAKPTEAESEKEREEPARDREILAAEDSLTASGSAPGESAKSSPAPPSRPKSPPAWESIPNPARTAAPPPQASPPQASPPASRPSAPAPTRKPPAVRGPSASAAASVDAGKPPPRRARRAVGGTGSSASPAVPAVVSQGRQRLGIVRFLELLLFSALAGAFMLLIFNQYWVRPRIEQLEARLEELTGSSRIGGPPGFGREQPGATSGPATESTEESVPSVEPPAEVIAAPTGPRQAVQKSVRESVQEAVQGWARAWSEQRVEDYLSYYAADFVPASGASRAVWEKRRRERLSAQGAIRVAVVSFQAEEISANEARVMFTQSYRSDAYRDRVRKVLRMMWIDDRWQIVEEVVIRQLPW